MEPININFVTLGFYFAVHCTGSNTYAGSVKIYNIEDNP